MSYPVPGPAFGAANVSPHGDTPLVLLFERDDAMAVPLLSQLRLAGYDVRAARTPVDLFDAAQKHAVSLIVVDLNNAAAGRREFWVALDAQRRGSATQVLTFRVVTPNGPLQADHDAAPHALADLEVGGPHEVPLLVEAVSRRVPLGAGQARPITPPPGIVGLALTGDPASTGTASAFPWHQDSSSPFASPAPGNPFSAAESGSPFDQPDARNPFAQTQPRVQPDPLNGIHGNTAGSPTQPPALAPAWPQHNPTNPTSGAGSFARIPAIVAIPAMPPANPGWPRAADPHANGHMDQFSANPGQSQSYGRPSYPGFTPETDGPRASSSPVTDAWMPPDGAALPSDASSSSAPIIRVDRDQHDWPSHGADEPARDGPTEPRVLTNGQFPARSYGDASPEQRDNADWPQAERSSARSSAQVAMQPLTSTGSALIRPEERALGAVLVEGALLSSQRLDILAEIRHMLTTVDVDIKLGELALLFRFLSPDQLLAALLVSRRLITPEQIAALGRIKQEMGASGINYDLETLLVMFNIMSREDLERLRSELA